MILKWSRYFRVGLNIGEMKNPKQQKGNEEQPMGEQEKCTGWVPLDRSVFLDYVAKEREEYLKLRRQNKYSTNSING